MANFITNSRKSDLKKRLVELIAKSDELKFLVGFFYFSGIRELYSALQKNPDVSLKVLVGLNVDRLNRGLIEYAEADPLSDEEKAYKFFESIKKSLNTEYFDTEEFYQQVRYFVDLIKNDKLIIRKTYEPNHAKLYIFKLKQDQVGKNTLFITGSSNLTQAGLSTQNEFNVEISDYGFEDAEEYFDHLWSQATTITEHEETKKRLIELIEKETLIKEISPFEAFGLILKTYLDDVDQKKVGDSIISLMEKNGYKPYQYQLDAMKQALKIIDDYNGVIIADVVGLGKTIIACAVAKQLNKRGIVICPPGIMGDQNLTSGWRMYVEQFKLHDWEVRSLGDLENTLEFVKKLDDIEVVIVDEAHRFRNQDTQAYDVLKNICRNKKVILLTATPFNNRPADILSLLSLFIMPKQSTITLDSNLVDQFRGFKGIFDRLGYIKKYHNSPDEKKRTRAQNHYKGLFGEDKVDMINVTQRSRYLAKQIRNVIEPVTIRRNRLDLIGNPYYKDEVKQLSKCADPQESFYELSKEQSEFYSRVIEQYFGDIDNGGRFQGAIYRPFEYKEGNIEKLDEKGNRQYTQQRNLFDFMRRMLVKRFESSFGAFEQSIKNFKKITGIAQAFIEKTQEYILDRDLLERIYEDDIEEIERQLQEYDERINRGEYPKNHERYRLKDFKEREKFVGDIQSDLDLFDEILNELNQLDLVKNDPKTARLVENVKRHLAQNPALGEPPRKIIIFSEYVDTVLYLKKELSKHFGERMLVVAGDLTSSKIRQINQNFDASYPEQKNDFDLLLTSDKISEGFNLNRAGMVINYDIPWNPVRVIQRVGRINRISKKVFDELYIVNFFPTERGAELVKSREIAANKMFLIHSALGEDAKIFDVDEEPTPAGLYKRIQQNPDEMEEESFYNKALREFIRIKKDHPEILENLENYPLRVKVAKFFTEDELLVFFKKGRMYVSALSYTSDKPSPEAKSFEEVFDKVRCEPEEKALPLSENFWPAYEAVKNHKPYMPGATSEQSLEQRALNMLNHLINNVQAPELMPYKEFLRTLKKDILNYGTLSDFSLRRISNFSRDEKRISGTVDEIWRLQKELGRDYLDKAIALQKELRKEIIIAIENQK
ncbi:MAG TPA: helicase-related protein [Smithellaceae bacterium]|nr:helicase-related protein [Smithellaceae bacterium]HRS88479.1 helicase-related protein [Smithellaceae bacterium]HRV25535.1 helicase-related protein [Smithellaceae bacterium]